MNCYRVGVNTTNGLADTVCNRKTGEYITVDKGTAYIFCENPETIFSFFGADNVHLVQKMGVAHATEAVAMNGNTVSTSTAPGCVKCAILALEKKRVIEDLDRCIKEWSAKCYKLQFELNESEWLISQATIVKSSSRAKEWEARRGDFLSRISERRKSEKIS